MEEYLQRYRIPRRTFGFSSKLQTTSSPLMELDDQPSTSTRTPRDAQRTRRIPQRRGMGKGKSMSLWSTAPPEAAAEGLALLTKERQQQRDQAAELRRAVCPSPRTAREQLEEDALYTSSAGGASVASARARSRRQTDGGEIQNGTHPGTGYRDNRI